MPVRIDERKGSGDFNRTSGKILFFVLGATDQDDAEALALADPRAAEQVGDFLLDDVDVSDQGGDLYFVDLSYKRGVPDKATETAGTTPGSARQAPPGVDHAAPLPRNVTVSMGGGTERVYQSYETTDKRGKGDDEPPNFFGLIAVDMKTRQVGGCDRYMSTAEFAIHKRMEVCTLGYFRHALDLQFTCNEEPWLGCEKGEVLFAGLDLDFRDGDPVPWNVSGRFKYSRNRANVPIDNVDPDLAELKMPLIRGHEFFWCTFEVVQEIYRIDGKDTPYMIQRPRFGYTERIYQWPREATSDGASFNDLGLN